MTTCGNSATSLAAGSESAHDDKSAFAHAQRMWRFLNDESVFSDKLGDTLRLHFVKIGARVVETTRCV